MNEETQNEAPAQEAQAPQENQAANPTARLPFSRALEELKKGYAIRRAGWNGKGMFVYLNKGAADFGNPSNGDVIDGISNELFERGDNGIRTRLPNINMRAASGNVVTGWLASQTDMLADDWEVVNEPQEQAAKAA